MFLHRKQDFLNFCFIPCVINSCMEEVQVGVIYNAPVPLAGDALRSYGVRKNEHIGSKIAEMVWWNISGATISHVLRFNCVSMANGWRTCGAYGAWMAMPLHVVSRVRTRPLRIHGASGVCIAYIPRTRGDQLDSTAYGGRMYSAWTAYTCRTYKYTSF